MFNGFMFFFFKVPLLFACNWKHNFCCCCPDPTINGPGWMGVTESANCWFPLWEVVDSSTSRGEKTSLPNWYLSLPRLVLGISRPGASTGLKTLPHQASSHYVLTTFFRMGSERDGDQKILSRFNVLDILARWGSLSPIHGVCTAFRKFAHSLSLFGWT